MSDCTWWSIEHGRFVMLRLFIRSPFYIVTHATNVYPLSMKHQFRLPCNFWVSPCNGLEGDYAVSILIIHHPHLYPPRSSRFFPKPPTSPYHHRPPRHHHHSHSHPQPQ